MASRREMLATRKKELLEMGYTKGLVEKALGWAVGSAEGVARHYVEEGKESELVNQMLPGFLKDCPKWMNGILGGPPGEAGKGQK